MWARRGRKLVQCMLLPAESAFTSAAVDGQVAGGLRQFTPFVAPLSGSRSFNTGFWDVPQSARHELYIELHTIRNMLPNRSPFIPHFTPHGVMLMPNSDGMQPVTGRTEAAAAAAAQVQAVGVDPEQLEASEGDEQPGMWADSVKRKRKLKMKKHKYKKRMKKLRHQQ